MTNTIDLVYQTFNISVPETAYDDNKNTPIFLKTNVGGYMASKASDPLATDATRRALLESLVIIVLGSRDSPGEMVLDIDLNTYLEYINSIRKLKTPHAFDSMGAAGANASPENNVFGNAGGSSANFIDFSLRKSTGNPSGTVDKATQEQVYLMNPMNFIGDGVSTTTLNWYIRHGVLDRDTSFPVPVNLYTKLMNNGYNVDFSLPWNRNHSGDYNLDELFLWIKSVVK